MHRHVHCGVGEVEEEGLRSIFGDEVHRFIGVAFGGGIAGVAFEDFDDFVVAHEREFDAAVVGKTKVSVEAVVRGEELGFVAEVPFADAHGGVVPGFQKFRDGVFRAVEAVFLLRHDGERNGYALRVGAGQHLRTRR
jgi:hypothetical protein